MSSCMGTSLFANFTGTVIFFFETEYIINGVKIRKDYVTRGYHLVPEIPWLPSCTRNISSASTFELLHTLEL